MPHALHHPHSFHWSTFQLPTLHVRPLLDHAVFHLLCGLMAALDRPSRKCPSPAQALERSEEEN